MNAVTDFEPATSLERARIELSEWLAEFNDALASGDATKVAGLFTEHGFWRDMLALTWNIKTVEGRPAIEHMLTATLGTAQPYGFAASEDPIDTGGVIDSWLTFETPVARCIGHVRLKDGKAWTLLTLVNELKGHEEASGTRRPIGAEHGAREDRQTWREKRQKEVDELGISTQPYTLIIGGGQGGIALAARLRHLGVPTLIVERNEKPGDSWRKRYKSLCLHDPVWYDHLPYIEFPKTWPVFSPKDKIADFLEMYANVMELNFWGSTTARSATYDEAKQEWTVVVERKGEAIMLHPKQLVLATGVSGKPNVPVYPGQDVFRGVQQHSSQHAGPEGWRGKKVIVVGSNNSSHDICAALWEEGADVTMVQRSSTLVVRSATQMKHALEPLYSESALQRGIDVEKADLIFASIPYRLLGEMHKPLMQRIREEDEAFYRSLEDAGFMLDYGEDDSGLFMKYLRRGSGYYIDVGASQLIANGEIKLKSRVSIAQIKAHSVVFSDDSELCADLIVYATGYGSMNAWAAEIISQEVADKVGKVWGLGSDTIRDPGPWEGELRNMWKPTKQEALWFHGGNLHQSRHYSKYLAIQLKARMEGIDTPVYGIEDVHHLS
ncbi:FAD-dependent oxidoreductase [Trinickia symbiotica]|uniref:FAD-dependent oxidoreductase n=1 Tax=Trinickia symbiotica TaxID=863227 RepID=A0A2T3XK46_9BURK|nr:NAD(P)/FAD-dependent oxidoreductase [Trinickia symbiotica]PTB16809.1 FAD-dependent oxidoreductase [Trinickia symbiotica]